MKLTAITRDGMNVTRKIEVTEIHTWIGRKVDHPVNKESLLSLLNDMSKRGRLSIYIWGPCKGEISAFDSTPLYTNGAENVWWLYLNDKMIWSFFNEDEFNEDDIAEYNDYHNTI